MKAEVERRQTERAAGWLGFEGADEIRLTALEERLGTRLPPSYRSFLETSDGWLNMSPFVWTMRSTGEVSWVRDTQPDLCEFLHDGGVDKSISLLLISGDGDAQYWLLDSGDVSADGEWAAYAWASWYPGFGERHASFAELVAAERASFDELRREERRPE